jgi:hypothetical protein
LATGSRLKGELRVSQHPLTKVHATGLINVKTYVPQPYDEPADGPKLVRIDVTETFTGDLAGEGAAAFLQVIRGDGSASFVGVERVVATVGGRSGSFVFQDQGRLDGKTVSGTWFVVPGSGTGQFVAYPSVNS